VQSLCDLLFIYILRKVYKVSMLVLLIFIFHLVSVALLINCTILVCVAQSFAQCLGDFLFFPLLRSFYEVSMLSLLIPIFHSVYVN
jgi:hypothetical protein